MFHKYRIYFSESGFCLLKKYAIGFGHLLNRFISLCLECRMAFCWRDTVKNTLRLLYNLNHSYYGKERDGGSVRPSECRS